MYLVMQDFLSSQFEDKLILILLGECSIYDSPLTKYLYAIHSWQVLRYLTLSWIICISFTHYIQSWTSSPGLNNMYINKGILL